MSGLGFAALAVELETFLAGALSLSAQAPTVLEGELRGGPATLTTRRYLGPSIHHARVAILKAPGIEIGNLVFFPALHLAAPILGIDLVSLPGAAGLVAADLSPSGAGAAALAAADLGIGLPSAGPLPAWASAIFSSRPLFARVGPSTAALAASAAHGLAEAFVEAVRTSPSDRAREPLARAALLHYCKLHRQDERTLGVLTRAFGEARARRYIENVLFPEVTA